MVNICPINEQQQLTRVSTNKCLNGGMIGILYFVVCSVSGRRDRTKFFFINFFRFLLMLYTLHNP